MEDKLLLLKKKLKGIERQLYVLPMESSGSEVNKIDFFFL